MIDLYWREELGRAAVEEHTAQIGNGQETEDFRTQALDAITNILHAVAVNDDELQVDSLLTLALVNFNCERDES